MVSSNNTILTGSLTYISNNWESIGLQLDDFRNSRNSKIELFVSRTH